MKQILYVGHNIFLSREQRYRLYNGKSLKVVGFNVCKSYPSKEEVPLEYFCIYNLIPKKIKNYIIKKNQKGYTIYIDNLNIPSIFEFFYKNKNTPCSAKNLIDIKDGGKEWVFLKKEENEKNFKTLHTIEIQKIESLLDSL